MTAPTATEPARDLLGEADRMLGYAEAEAEQSERQRMKEVLWRKHFADLIETRPGRREVRSQLRSAGFNVHDNSVSSVFSTDHGVMCLEEGKRVRGLQLLWLIVRMLAKGDIPLQSFRLLMTETDE